MRTLRDLSSSFLSLVIFLLIGGLSLNAEVHEQANRGISSSRQLIVVTTEGWNAVDGELRRYERTKTGQAWKPVGEMIPVVVGRNGMAWGEGLHGAVPISGKDSYPVKKEGDGRSPAGIYGLSSAFGYAPRGRAGNLKLPYTQAVKTLECVDDPQSTQYNKVIDRNSVNNPDWKSSEQMLRDDDLYRLGVIVDYNTNGQAGCGSCIFLHIWEGPGKGTAGCTAMAADRMEEVLRWLDAEKRPAIAQLPRIEFEKYRKVWKLPE
jgi:D-alanyl-D-alanine dipeptidase